MAEKLEASEATQATEQEDNHGPLYWLVVNSSKRIRAGISNLFRKRPVLAFLLLLLFIYMVVAGRAYIQPAFLFVRKFLVVFILAIALLYIISRLFRSVGNAGKIAMGLLIVGLGAGLFFYGAPMVNYLALYYHYNSIQKVELSKLPLTQNERIQPLNSIVTKAREEALADTEEATLPHFVRRADGSFDFSMAVGPARKYPIQRLMRNMTEVISVSGTAPATDFSERNRSNVRFDVGENLIFSKNTRTAAIKRFNLIQFFSYEADEVRFLENDKGEWVQVVSLIRWKGFLFPRPVFGGVLVIDQAEAGIGQSMQRIFLGEGQWVKPRSIPDYDWLNGQNLVPEKAARFTAESFRFHEGFLAPFPGYHEGDIRIPKMPDDHNNMPYVTWFDFADVSREVPSGLYNYFGLEPFQETRRGLNMSLFIPGDKEDVAYYVDHAGDGDALTGSSAIATRIRESKKNYDWDNNYPAESRPFIRDVGGERRFFWLSTVVTGTKDASGGFIGGTIPDLTITDARFGQVVWINRENIGKDTDWEGQIAEELQVFWDN